MRLDNKTIQMASGPNYAALTTLFKDGVPQTHVMWVDTCLLYTSPSPRDRQKSRMPSSA